MTEQARGDLAAIDHQALALQRFGSEAGEAVEQARRAAAEVVAQIAAELSARSAELRRAEAALTACSRQREADCSSEARQVERAAERVRAASAALRIAQQAASTFEPRQARFRRELDRLVGEGLAQLRAAGGDIEQYLAGAAAGGGGGGGGSQSAPGPGGLPAGWAMVPLAAIDDGDDAIMSPAEFGKGYSPQDLAWAYDALHEVVLPAMRQGKGADYFAARDQAEGRYGTRSYSDTYGGFFGGDAIKLDGGPGGYTVANGRHRIWVARQLGLGEIPARVA